LLRFKREFRALREVQHPNLIRLGELIEEHGRWFFTMELVESRDVLTDLREAPDPTARLRSTLKQLASGLIALHAAGKPDQPRVEHFPRIRVPCLFASGTRDSLAGREALTEAVKAIKGPVTMHWLESADHGYRPRKSSGRTADEVAAEVAEVSVQWVQSLAA